MKLNIKYVIISAVLVIVAFTIFGNFLSSSNSVEDNATSDTNETSIPAENDKPNLLLMLVVLIGLSFIVMIIIEKKGKR